MLKVEYRQRGIVSWPVKQRDSLSVKFQLNMGLVGIMAGEFSSCLGSSINYRL